jgi:hypothetical protein
MKTAVKIFFPLATTLFLGSQLQAQGQVPVDSVFVMYQRDSAVVPKTDATVLFFQQNERLTPANLAAISIITKAKKTVKLSTFMKGETMQYADPVFADLDNDGRKELLISNFTGGAHCCDELYIYKYVSANKYQQVAKLFAGNTVITPQKEFVYDFHENFGYFFTCFACGYTDTSDAAPIHISEVTLRYSKGKLLLVPGNSELKSIINDNLGKLGEKPYQVPDADLNQDDGLRKEMAINLAVYYYSFGKNLIETQKLFNKYYKHPDAKKVWTAFAKQLQYIRTVNDF